MKPRFDLLVLMLAGFTLACIAMDQSAAPPVAEPSKFRSEDDGAFDVSSFLDGAYGFLPLEYKLETAGGMVQ